MKCGGHASLCFVFRLRQRLETFLWKRGFCAHRYLCLCVARGNFGCVSVHSKIGNHKRVAFDITHKSLKKNPQQSSSSHVGYWLKGASGFWEVFPGVFSYSFFHFFNSKSTRAYTTRETKMRRKRFPALIFKLFYISLFISFLVAI